MCNGQQSLFCAVRKERTVAFLKKKYIEHHWPELANFMFGEEYAELCMVISGRNGT